MLSVVGHHYLCADKVLDKGSLLRQDVDQNFIWKSNKKSKHENDI